MSRFDDYYDWGGNPISMEEWIALRKERKLHVDQTDLPGDVSVSTVHLGMDHQWGDGPPLIFETMIFGGPLDQDQYRYSTLDQAKAGHARAVRLAELANAARFVEAK